MLALLCSAPLVFSRRKRGLFSSAEAKKGPPRVLITVSQGERAAPSDQNVTGHHSSAGPAGESVGGRASGALVPGTWEGFHKNRKGKLPSFLRKRKLGSIMSTFSEFAISASPEIALLVRHDSAAAGR